jgi:hypothetical protein
MNYYAHQLAWLYMTGQWPNKHIDHINGIRDDNRFSNLRLATESDNSCNRAKQSNNVSGYTGVWWNSQKKRWEASIFKDGKRQWRKFFDSKEEAIGQRALMLGEFHGEFTVNR